MTMKKPSMVRESIGLYDAKTHFSELIEQVQQGQSVVITKHGKPVAELVPANVKTAVAKRGAGKGPGFFMAEDFDAPLEDFSAYQ